MMDKENFQKVLCGYILEHLVLTGDIVRVDSFTAASMVGTGTVTCEIGNWLQAAPGAKAWMCNISVLGMTFASEDADKSIIRRCHEDVIASISALSKTFPGYVLEGAAIAGVTPVTNSALRENEDQFMFTVDFGLAITNTPF